MKTRMQEELHQFLIPFLKGKEYSEKMKLIAEMQEYLTGIKNALYADHTFVLCEKCNTESKATEWETETKNLCYNTNLNDDYNEDDQWVKIQSIGTYAICPHCGEKKLIHEKIINQCPIKVGI